jgi:hypothetical protein
MLGIGVEGAAKTQNIAADKMVDSSTSHPARGRDMLRAIVPSSPATGTPGTTTPKTPDTKAPAWLGTLKKIGEYAAVAYGGYQAGQASGSRSTARTAARSATTSSARSAARSPVQRPARRSAPRSGRWARGGRCDRRGRGFIGGIVGVHKASKEAAEATKQLRDALEQSMQSLRNRVNHDDLGEAIRQVNEERKKAAQQIEDAYAYGDKNSANVKERNRLLAEMNALEDKYIAQLKEEAAAKSRYFTEDLSGAARAPLNPPALSRADSVGSTGTATPARYSFTLLDTRLPCGRVFQINGNRSGEEMLGEIAAALDDVKERTLGGTNTATRADALQRVTARRSTTVSIS